jgi:hypothetical protein
MSRDQAARIVCHITGGACLFGLIYFATLPRPAALDFREQMALSRFAGLMAFLAAATLAGGFFRQERRGRIMTIVYGSAMSLLWLLIAAGNFPVA